MEKYGDRVPVECRVGRHGQEEPQRFLRGEQCVEVAEILDRWLDPAHRYFKVRGTDGSVSMLRHDTASRAWELYVFPPR